MYVYRRMYMFVCFTYLCLCDREDDFSVILRNAYLALSLLFYFQTKQMANFYILGPNYCVTRTISAIAVFFLLRRNIWPFFKDFQMLNYKLERASKKQGVFVL